MHPQSQRVTDLCIQEIFSLLAYHDVYESPTAHLLDKSCRDDLATALNTAVLSKLSCE